MSTERKSAGPEAADGPPAEGSSNERGPLVRCLRVAIGAVVFVCGIFPPSLIFNWSIGPLAQMLLAVVAGLLFAFHLVNIFRTRVKLEHWQIEGLRPLLRSEILAGCISPLLVMTLVFLLPPSWWMLLLLACAFGFSQLIYEPVQRQIRRRVDEADKKHGTEHFRGRTMLTKFGVDESLDDMAKEKQGPGLWKWLIALGEEPWQEGMSRTRSLIVYVLIACAALGGAASADVYVHDRIHGKGDDAQMSEGEEGDGSRPSGEGAGAGAGAGAHGTLGQDGDSGDSSVADGRCRFDLGVDIPTWARDELRALYFGGANLDVTDPPGTDIGGCPGDVFVRHTLQGLFIYTIAKGEEGEILSLAVTSRQLGPAIFLAPAAQRALDLIRNGIAPLGGYPKVDVREGDSEGDMVPVTTLRGTIVLVRAEKVLRDRPTYARPYLELPIAVASAWTAAMRDKGDWLWPLESRRHGGKVVYRFSESAESVEPVAAILYDSETGTATVGNLEFRPPQAPLSQLELEDFARRAGS